MILEILVGGLLFMGGTAVCRRINLPPVRSLLPSKTLRGSPEDLDPNEIAFNLVITRMLRNIEAVTIGERTVKYRDDKVNHFEFITNTRFENTPWQSEGFYLCIKIDKNVIERNYSRCNSKFTKKISSVREVKLARDSQKAKEFENRAAFAVIEALTETGLPVKLEGPMDKGEPFTR